MAGPASLGGISSLIRTLLPVLKQQVDLQFFPTVRGRPPKKAGRVSAGNLFLALSQYARFIFALIKYRPEIVHLHTSQGIGWLKDSFFVLISKALGLRIVLHIHAADFDQFYLKTPRLMQAYTRWAVHLADAVISVSEQWKHVIAQIAPPDRMHLFLNCINIEEIPPRENGLPLNGVSALFLGAVGERKGVPELLEAAHRLHAQGLPFHIWIAGSEEKQGELLAARRKIGDLRLEAVCELTGDVREERKQDLLKRADLFVLPSHHEGLPIAMLEGMAAGLAVVATPVGGIPEVVKDGYNGFLVPPGNVEALAEKLALLVQNPQLCRTMGQLNRKIAEQELDVKPYAARLVQLYQSLA